MAKDTKALQYMYAPPFLADYSSPKKFKGQLAARGGKALTIHTKPNGLQALAKNEEEKVPFVIFPNVRCTKDSYQIDVFIAGAASLDPDPTENADFIGRVTRIGMGDGGDAVNGVRNFSRCKKPAISRILEVGDAKGRLRQAGSVQIVVTELASGRELAEEEWKALPGFEARVVGI
jgi:hypothetical protein